MKKIKIFVHTNNNRSFLTADVNEDSKIGHLVKDFTPDLANHKDSMEDVEVYLEDQDDDFDKGITIAEADIKHGDHIFIGRCKKITVTINYAGKTDTEIVSPSTSIKKLKKLAVNFFGIDEGSAAELMLWFNNQPLDYRQLIGSLTDYPSCGVSLVLATKKDVNGDPSRDILLEHLNSSEYQSGEIERRWGAITNENRPDWPIFIFWINGKENKSYYFRFDLTDYPNLAPTSVIWDLELKHTLVPEKRPTFNKRARQVFKKWGKECNYLPCDRLAIEGHNNWMNDHSSLIWNSNSDTILKYLNELYQILNN